MDLKKSLLFVFIGKSNHYIHISKFRFRGCKMWFFFKNLSYNYLPWANLCLPPHGAVPDGYHTCLSKAFGHTSSNTAPQEHH